MKVADQDGYIIEDIIFQDFDTNGALDMLVFSGDGSTHELKIYFRESNDNDFKNNPVKYGDSSIFWSLPQPFMMWDEDKDQLTTLLLVQESQTDRYVLKIDSKKIVSTKKQADPSVSQDTSSKTSKTDTPSTDNGTQPSATYSRTFSKQKFQNYLSKDSSCMDYNTYASNNYLNMKKGGVSIDLNMDCRTDLILETLGPDRTLEIYFYKPDGFCLVAVNTLSDSDSAMIGFLDVLKRGTNDLVIITSDLNINLYMNKYILDNSNMCTSYSKSYDSPFPALGSSLDNDKVIIL